MLYHYKALLIVILITLPTFMLLRGVFIPFMQPRDFDLRRNTWFILTFAQFLILDFWAFLLLLSVVVAFTSRRDSSPVAHYIFLLLAVLPISAYAYVPGVIANFMLLDHLRVLDIVILLPVAISLMFRRESAKHVKVTHLVAGERHFSLADGVLLVYLALQLALVVPRSSGTGNIRMVSELLLFTLIPYYAISRYIDNRERLVDAIAAFCLSVVTLVPLGLFETVRHWALYEGVQTQWGKSTPLEYLMRGPFLRAQVTGGHSLVFGFSLSIAFGLWMFLQGDVKSRHWRLGGTAAFVSGLVASFARGPWVGALAILVAFFALGPNPAKRTGLLTVSILAFFGVVILSPYGASIVDYLPFIGTVGEGSVDYRQKIATVAWEIVKINPLFGSFDNSQALETLRQGQGIIDIVNTYASVAMNYGLIGMSLYITFYLVLAFTAWRESRRVIEFDPRLSRAGTSISACLVGALITIATVSQYLSVPVVLLMIAGLARAYISICRRVYVPVSALRQHSFTTNALGPR